MANEFKAPSKELIEEIWEEFGLNEKRIEEAVEKIQDWLELQPHLPKESGRIHRERLERWLVRNKNSMERTKQSIDMYYTLKTITPELMCNLDTRSKWFKTVSRLAYFMPMPKLTPDGDRVISFGLFSSDATDLIVEDWFRISLMTTEVRMCEDYSKKDIFVLDLAKYTLAHASKFNFPSLKKVEVCTMKGFSTRLKAFHLTNAPPFSEILVGLIKAVLKSKLAARVFVHGSDLTTFHKQVPKCSLPAELEGECGTAADNWANWMKKMESYQDWFLKHEDFKSDEKKRPGGNFNTSDAFGFEGSFRKLNVD